MRKTSIYTKTFISLLLANMFFWLSNNIFMPVLPLYYHSLGMNDHQIGLAVGIFSLGAVGLRLYSGKAADKYGTIPILTVGMVVSLAAIASYAVAATLLAIMAARLLHGAGISSYSASALTTTSLICDEHHTTEAVSMYTLFTMIGVGIAASIANWLYARFGFNVVIAVGAVTTFLSLLLFPRHPEMKSKPRQSESLPMRAVIGDPAVYVPTLSLLAVSICFGTVMTFLPLLLVNAAAYYLTAFYACYAAAVIFSRFWVIDLCRRFTAKRLSMYVLLLFAFVLAIISKCHSLIILGICGMGVGVSYGLAFPSLASIVTEHTQPANRGTAFGFLTMAVDAGAAIGAMGMGAIAGWLGYSGIFLLAGAYTFGYAMLYEFVLKQKITILS